MNYAELIERVEKATGADRAGLTEKDVARFWSKVAKSEGGCWLWTGAQVFGYGQFSVGARANHTTKRAHRVSYLLCVGDVPDGLSLDHLCRVRHCVRPDHLEVVTTAVNNQRAAAARPTCINGHPWDAQSPIRGRNGTRECRLCKRARKNAARAKVNRQRLLGLHGESAQ